MCRLARLSLIYLALGVPTFAIAQDVPCDPKEHLARDIVSLDEDLETNLVLLDELLQTKSKDSSTSVSGSYSGYTFTGNDARKASSSLKKLLNIKYTERQKRTLFTSALSPKGVDAYVKCLELNKAHLSVTISEGAVRKKEVLISIKWHPQYAAPPSANIGTLISGGKVAEVLYENKNYSNLSEIGIKPQTTVTLKIARDSIFEPTEIAGAVDGQPLRIDIPNTPKFRLVTEVKEGSAIKFGPTRETCVAPQLSSCVSIVSSDEGVLLPGSFRWKAPVIENLQDRPIANESTEEDTNRICRKFTLGCPKLFKNYAHIEKTGTALLVKAVPIKE